MRKSDDIAGAGFAGVRLHPGRSGCGIAGARGVVASGGHPNSLTITGITTPVDSDPLVLTRAIDQNGYPSWTFDDWIVSWFAGLWSIIKAPGSGIYTASATSNAPTPVGLTFDAPSDGAGVPVVAIT